MIARNGRDDVVERTTSAFRQPPDEIPKALEIPYSCRYEGKWYREGEEFRMGPNDCSICICIDTQVNCNDDACIPPTTTTSTTTTTLPPFIPLPGDRGDRGERGERGQPVKFLVFIIACFSII